MADDKTLLDAYAVLKRVSRKMYDAGHDTQHKYVVIGAAALLLKAGVISTSDYAAEGRELAHEWQ